MTRSIREVELVARLAAAGSNPSEIARKTGIPRGTVSSWLHGRIPTRHPRLACMRCTPERFSVFRPLTESGYAYLLGIYLGDGCISLGRRGVYRLRAFLDRSYPVMADECVAAMRLVMPASKASVHPRNDEHMNVVSSFSTHWPCLFPQHGSGRKHLREIQLAGWQQEIADRYPARLLRGLIHSDGYRGLNTVKRPTKAHTYSYPRYQFCNRSADIRSIFCEYCDRLGIEWRRMNRVNISVARAESVARLDRFVGPKR